MKSSNNNPRRQFLRNTAFSALGLSAALPIVGKTCNRNNGPEEKTELNCDPTTQDYFGEGPFYTDNPPTLTENMLASPSEPGTRLVISGRVVNLNCGEFLADTIIDVWHANAAGDYDNQGYNLRGQFRSNAQGFYLFETIMPGKYLNGSSFRPAHIHFKITPPGFPTLTTQLYFAGDPDLDTDASSSITSGDFDASSRIVTAVENASSGKLEASWDIVIDGEGGVINATNDLHIDKGMIYEAGPNPFRDQLEIRYGVFRPAKVGLLVFDASGRQVAVLEDSPLNSDKYVAHWSPDSNLKNGHYFVALRVNELQVSYLKVVKS